jgi:hypothetical protein
MSKTMSLELEEWLDEWSAKLDSVESIDKEEFDFSLFEKFTGFILKVCSFPQKHFFIAVDEEE